MLHSYIDSFLGYGNPTAKHWFVGMEEGGVESVAGLQKRVQAWHARGSRALEDLLEYHHAISETRFFNSPYPLQRTWAGLLRFEAAFTGLPADKESIRLRQHSALARDGSNSVLAELMPLPAKNTAMWPYAELAAQHPVLESRERYLREIMPARIDLLRSAIQRANPAFVLFYGSSYLEHWRSIAGVAFTESLPAGQRSWLGRKGDTVYVVTPHPVAHGLTTAFWIACGELATRLAR
jgi:hypothetical protein